VIARLTSHYMHCSGCRVDHPVGLFSAAQRRVPSRKRVCIGREGFVRLCDHKVVTWVKVASIAMEITKPDTGSEELDITIDLFQCLDNSHFPKHHGKNSPQILNQQIGPCVGVRRNSRDSVSVHLKWLGHLCLPDLDSDELFHDGRATPGLLRRYLEHLRQGAAEFIAPEFPPGRLTEMNCFDPNRCCCLRLAGVEELPYGWQLAPLQELKRSNCREHPEHLLRALHPSKDYRRGSSYVRREWTGAHCVGVQTTGTLKYGSSRVVVRVDPCAGESRCLQIKYNRRIAILPKSCRPGRVTMAWCQALDPDSYNLTDDTESYGVLWCRQRGCRNYYRYLKKALVPLGDTHRECTKSCTT
jgi:hypothetical protein